MKIELLNYTQEADALLIFTKQTRLSMDAGLLAEIKAWPEERKRKELDYMLKTIPSSWEFVDYTFQLSGVTRAFCLQALRTRSAEYGPDEYLGKDYQAGSFAGQSQRTVDMSNFNYEIPEKIDQDCGSRCTYIGAMGYIKSAYGELIKAGIPPQDARGLLPHAAHTNVIGKYNLRTLHDMAQLRLCSRSQGEYQRVFREMHRLVIGVHPWAEPFLRVYCASVGVCAFPNYRECPIKPGMFNPETGSVHPGVQDYAGKISVYSDHTIKSGILPLTKAEIQARWEKMDFEAVPKETK